MPKAVRCLLLLCLAAACGAARPPKAPEAARPAAPETITPIQLLIDHAADLNLSADQISALTALAEKLADVNAPILAAMAKAEQPASRPAGSGDQPSFGRGRGGAGGAGGGGGMRMGRGRGRAGGGPPQTEDDDEFRKLRRKDMKDRPYVDQLAHNVATALAIASCILEPAQRPRAQEVLGAEGYDLPMDAPCDETP